MISSVENYWEENETLAAELSKIGASKDIPVLGITGTGGAG